MTSHDRFVSFWTELIILCGDEPCDMPGRNIYTGTYVSCRPKDGLRARFFFKVNGKMIKLRTQSLLSEISYQLTAEDTDTIEALCHGGGLAVNFNYTVDVSFTVYEWPC